MSRYTRMLRKQAKAAAKAGPNGAKSHGKTPVKLNPALAASPSEGVSTYVVGAGPNGSLVLHPLGGDHSSVQNRSEKQGNKSMPMPLSPTQGHPAAPSLGGTAAASSPSPTNRLLDNPPGSGGMPDAPRPVIVNSSPQPTQIGRAHV